METTVSLVQMLDARERRVQHQQELLARYHKPLICFTMNICGPVKDSPLIRRGFARGRQLLRQQFLRAKLTPLYQDAVREVTGCEAFYVLDADPLTIKKFTTDIEDATPLGRLFDMDVIRPDGLKVDREELDLEGRRCLICGGGGYTLNAAKSDKRFAAVATISMFNTGLVRRMGYMNSAADTVQERLKAASDAHAAEMLKGEAALSGTVDFDAISPEEAAKIPNDLYREGLEYYGRTHRHPNATFSYTTSSLMDLMTWDATDQIELISVPLLMIAGSKADSLYMTQDAFAKASGTSDKELYEIPGATHIQTYYVPEYVEQEQARLVEFFNSKL